MTLYDELGVPATATTGEMHAAYRAKVRSLHPDARSRSSDPEADREADAALRRLNNAWEVLRDPPRRRSYDNQVFAGPGSPASPHGRFGPAAPSSEEDWVGSDAGTRPHFRWWIVAVAVLLAVFVFSAYAGSPTNTDAPRSSTVGRCLARQPGVDAVVDCAAANEGRIVAEISRTATCPSGSRAVPAFGGSRVLCLVPSD